MIEIIIGIKHEYSSSEEIVFGEIKSLKEAAM